MPFTWDCATVAHIHPDLSGSCWPQKFAIGAFWAGLIFSVFNSPFFQSTKDNCRKSTVNQMTDRFCHFPIIHHSCWLLERVGITLARRIIVDSATKCLLSLLYRVQNMECPLFQAGSVLAETHESGRQTNFLEGIGGRSSCTILNISCPLNDFTSDPLSTPGS